MTKLERVLLPPIKENAHIRVVSLSAPVAADFPERYSRSLRNLRALNFEVSESRHASAKHFHMAGTVSQRTDDFLEAWFDDDVDLILSVIGGHSTHQILPNIPFSDLAKAPKTLVGYSDTTTLMLALLSQAGIPSLCGPALMPQFGEFGGPHPYTKSEFFAALDSTLPYRTIESTADIIEERLRWGKEDTRSRKPVVGRARRCWRPGTATGEIIVANMGCLLLLAGTPYMPDLSGSILVIEDDDSETPESIDRYFTQMKQIGIFDSIKGLVVGRFPKSVGLCDAVLDELLERSLGANPCPVLTDVEIGHVDPVTTIPSGVQGFLSATDKTLTVTSNPFSK